MTDTDQIADSFPLCGPQAGIHAGQRLDPGSPRYNAAEYVEINGPVDHALLEEAVNLTLAETDALRCRFVGEPGAASQVLLPHAEVALPLLDLTGDTDGRAAAAAWMAGDVDVPIDPARGPLFGQALLRTKSDRYLWYLKVHHIALDGFGFSLLIRRAAAWYTALDGGGPPPGRKFGRLRDVVAEDAAYRGSTRLERDRKFWSEHLSGLPEPVNLAGRYSTSTSTAIRCSARLSSEQERRLHTAAEDSGLTWTELLTAAASAYLWQRTEAEELLVGLVSMGRLGSVSARVPCMKMNILPLRLRTPARTSLTEWGRTAAREMRTVHRHQHYRYEQIRRDLGLVGGERRLLGPVVNIVPFTTDLDFSGSPAVVHSVSMGPVEDFSVTVRCRPDGSALRVELNANPHLYDEEDLSGHREGLMRLLDEALRDPGRALGPAPPTLLDGGAAPPSSALVTELVQRWAERCGEHVAVEHADRSVSYRELLASATALASRITDSAAAPDRPVAVLLPRGVEAVVAFLGVLFAGRWYVPLDVDGPEERNRAVLEDAGADLLLTTPRLRAQALRLPGDDSPVEVLEVEGETGREPPTPPMKAARLTAESPAYCIYTSGSTGRPKGVVISHGALANLVAGATPAYGVGKKDRVLQFYPLHFDASVEEIFLTLCAGATLVVRTPRMAESVQGLLSECAEKDVTVLSVPTALWHEWVHAMDFLPFPGSVRTVIIGGEGALPRRVAQWNASAPAGVRLFHTYGPTETTVTATCAEITVGDEDDVPIGRLLPGFRAVVVNPRTRRPCPPGQIGELYLLGRSLAHGYLRQPQHTRERFVPFTALPGAPTAYRTGDLVRVRSDGQLVFSGRLDEEFKISGHRVHPAEVESALASHPSVREAAVAVQALANGLKRVVADAVVDGPAKAPDAAALRRHLRGLLPAAMVPATIALTDRLPRTSSGKIDRGRLKALASNDPAPSTASGLTRSVLLVWEQVLGRRDCGADDDFFALGGESLQAIQAATRIGVELDREVPAALLFRYPTAASLAEALTTDASEDADEETAPPTRQVLADAVLPDDVSPAPPPAAEDRVLLTGATGFVGANLLAQLLLRGKHVTCLVRCADPQRGLRRLVDALLRQGLFTDAVAAAVEQSVTVVPADLSAPRLGLSTTRWRKLAEECDTIYHSAATVSLLRGYTSVRAANVLGTRELLRLAAEDRTAPLHHVSTLAVCPLPAQEEFVAHHPGLRDGYQQSKWAAEHLVEQAVRRGLPAAVHRLGRVVGSAATGYVNPQDIVWHVICSGLRAGMLPDLRVREPWAPVDHLAHKIVRTRPSASAERSVHHPFAGHTVELAEVFAWVADYGYPVRTVSPRAWRERVGRDGGTHPAVLAFCDPRNRPGQNGGEPPGSGDRTTRAADTAPPPWPPITRDVFHRYLDHGVATGLLPAPEC